MLSVRKIDRQTWVKFFTHLIAIIIIFFLPDMMMNYGREHRFPLMECMMYFKAAAFVAVFYINYYFIVNRTLLAKKSNYIAFVLWNMLLIVAFIALFYLLRQMLWEAPPPTNRHHHEVPRTIMMIRDWSYVLRDVGIIILTIALSAALRYAERWAAIEKRHQKLQASQRDEELKNLKSQLNPHFLFNTLNTIYSLIEIDPKEAQKAVHQLSKLLRHVLYESPMQQSISQEIDFAKSYITLMEMRLGQGAVKTDFSHIADENLQIAPMLFITLIENAFKHGNTGNREVPIEISISADAAGKVVCRTYNHYVQRSSDQSPDHKKGGIGLSNLRRRLQLIYGHDAELSTKIVGDTYTAILTINTRPEQ